MSKQSTDADVKFIQALADLLNKNELTELSVKRNFGTNDSLDVRVAKQAAVSATSIVEATPAPVTTSPAQKAPATNEDLAQHPGALTSPMVGTVYLSVEPGSAPFVGIGSVVTEGQTLLIIEAMKTMNHIPSTRAGTVKRIVVTDGTPVEYGALLLIIE
jgi:acetyl-CoA carboxylase biotin carboxyl carrier protein